MVVPSTVHTYLSVTEEQLEKLPATMFPRTLEAQIRQGVDAWSQQDCLRELAALNKERLIPVKAKK